jgi:N-carbamoylputrescine amidase
MRISLIQMNSRANRLEENVERACAFVARAAGDKAELVVLPEFFNREYFPQYRDYKYMDYAEDDDGYTQSRMKQAARDHGIWLVSTIFEMERPGLSSTPPC